MYSTLMLGLALSVAAPGAKEPPKKEAPSIVGEWEGVKAVAGGKEKPVPAGGVTFTFAADGKMKAKEGGREEKGDITYKIDPKKSPAEIDIDGGDGKSMLGIYKIEGDTLTLALGDAKDGGRPGTFESPDGAKVMLVTFKRMKK